jgi:hypothetical protein
LSEADQIRLPDEIAALVWKYIFNHPNSSFIHIFFATRELKRLNESRGLSGKLYDRFETLKSKPIVPGDLFALARTFEILDQLEVAKTFFTAIVTSFTAEHDVYSHSQEGLDRLERFDIDQELYEDLCCIAQLYLEDPRTAVERAQTMRKTRDETFETCEGYSKAVKLEADGRSDEAIGEYKRVFLDLGEDAVSLKKALA